MASRKFRLAFELPDAGCEYGGHNQRGQHDDRRCWQQRPQAACAAKNISWHATTARTRKRPSLLLPRQTQRTNVPAGAAPRRGLVFHAQAKRTVRIARQHLAQHMRAAVKVGGMADESRVALVEQIVDRQGYLKRMRWIAQRKVCLRRKSLLCYSYSTFIPDSRAAKCGDRNYARTFPQDGETIGFAALPAAA
jgi:hypothetical protein